MGRMAVVAIGGNSLIKDDADPSVAAEIEALTETAAHLGALVAQGWDVVITHGNGPQVGFNLLRSEMAARVAPVLPLDVLGAQTQGSLGYMIQQVLGNELRRRNMDRPVVSVVTQVVVDATDPAFDAPSKPIGHFYRQAEAEWHTRNRGWTLRADAGRGWRRVAASPRPLEILEHEAIRALVRAGFVVVAAGGGGIPVVRDARGHLRGVEAVIDKDLASSLLARRIGADLLLFSTAVERVALWYGTPRQRDLEEMRAAEGRRYLAEGHFPPGSMGPKIEGALDFVESTGGETIITAPEHIERALRGETGTRIRA
ncbi:MAG: carbamate kinase [Armatimonadetes bacterium]|nr:carbamate kinase [Armatimonadota bacterium]